MWIGLETHSLPLHEQGTYCHSFRPTRVCVCVCARTCVCPVISDSLQPHGLRPTRVFCPWNTGIPCPGDLPGLKPVFLASPVLAVRFFTSWATRNPRQTHNTY